MNPKNQKNKQKINVEYSEEVVEGTYSNFVIVSHSNSEFLVDFVRLLPNQPKAKVKSRILMTPYNAKRMLKALSENIKKFENQFGQIQDPGGNEGSLPPMNFNMPSGEA